MREIELKLILDPGQERRLRRSPVVEARALARARTQTLHTQYFDTADDALRGAGIALRLRKAGRRWVQTVKKADRPMANGLSQPIEVECPLPGPALRLELIADDDLREEVIGLARAGIAPVVETRFQRTARRLTAPGGGLVELAIDKGVLIGAGQEAPLLEAELELIEGAPGDLFALATELFAEGPVRFAAESKSERALVLAGKTAPPPPLRKARRVALPPDETIEGAALAILSEGLGHYLPNLALLLETDDPGGPHQVRVALRRLRSALSAFRPALGRAALARWGDRARNIAAEAGRLRDLDVLATELVAPFAVAHPNEPGFAVLRDAVTARRQAIQAEVRAHLAGSEVTGFGFGFAGFLAARGWLDPADHDQTRRLAAPMRPFAQKSLTRRWKAVAAYGNRIDDLSIDERHEMRKELKKLRYLVDGFRSLFDPQQVEAFIAQVKRVQTGFGALNDSAMAEILLTGPDAPGSDDPAAARAAGRMIGHLLAEADHQWPGAVKDWRALAQLGPFWKA